MSQSQMQVRQGERLPGVRDKLEASATGTMMVMGERGDTRVIWNPRDTDEVAAVKKQFEELVGTPGEGGRITGGKRFLAFRVTDDGSKGVQIKEFDPNAQKLILAPPMAGGQSFQHPIVRGEAVTIVGPKPEGFTGLGHLNGNILVEYSDGEQGCVSESDISEDPRYSDPTGANAA